MTQSHVSSVKIVESSQPVQDEVMERALVLAALLTAAGGSLNYCGAKMCARSNAHTYCQYAPGPGPRCTGYISEPLSSEEKARVLARLNRRRAEAARGALRHLPPAGNMLKLRWVEELAREAQLWADQCAPPAFPEERDVCRDLYSISVGQCVASVVGEAPGLRAESLADTWFLQGLHRGNLTYPTNSRQYDLDFAQMMWAHTYLVGCARSRFMSAVNGRMRTVIRLVCNMAPRGPAGGLWFPAAPASSCPPRARPDRALPTLCSYLNETSDIYDVSNEMTEEEQTVLNAVLEIERNASLDHPGSLDEIYLTNMAIATLNHPTSTEPYPKSAQKRDIIEPIFQDKEVIKLPGTKVHILDEVIAKMVRDKLRTRENQVINPNIVGRPKYYLIEELNSPFPEKDLNYAKTRPLETITVSEPDAYLEYGFQDSSEIPEEDANVSVTENEVKLSSISTNYQNLTETATGKTELPLSSVADNFTLDVNVTNDALKRLLELSKKTEEQPFDPETARQLQQALERVEMSLATETHGKVRRDLRRRREEPEPRNQETQEPSEQSAPHSSKPQMLDMMMKYLPFMKKYQKINSAASLQLDIYSVCVMFILYV